MPPLLSPLTLSARLQSHATHTRAEAGAARGFTLIELLVVIAILAILITIAIPSYQSYVTRSKIRTAQSDLMALSTLVENHRQRTLSYPSAAAAGTAAVVEAFPGWGPASKDGDFSFSYAFDDGYTLTASGAGGRLSGCTLTLGDDNQRAVSGCPAVGDVSW